MNAPKSSQKNLKIYHQNIVSCKFKFIDNIFVHVNPDRNTVRYWLHPILGLALIKYV